MLNVINIRLPWWARAALLCALTALPATAWAQVGPTVSRENDQNTPITLALVDPCTFETVAGTGKQDTHTQSQQSINSSYFHFFNHQLGNLTGQTSGAQYQYEDWGDQESHSSSASYWSRFTARNHVIRTSSPGNVPDDFFLHFSFELRVTNSVPTFTLRDFGPDGCK